MIVSNKPRRLNSHWLQKGVLLCLMVMLPLSIVSAQDYEAVERRLGEAVSKGELSLKQAQIMMDALRKAGSGKKDQAPDKTTAYLMQVKEKLGAAVEAGKMTKDEAAKKYIAAKEAVQKKLDPGKDQGPEQAKTYLTQVKKKLDAAVGAGKMTKDEAAKKYIAAKEVVKEKLDAGKDQDPEQAKTYLTQVKKRLDAAVESGKMSKEDASRKYEGAKAAVKERLAAGKDQGPERAKIYLMQVKEKLDAAVGSGKVTKDEAAKKYMAAKETVKQRLAAGGPWGDSQRITPREYARAEADLRQAVAEGKISAQDARARLRGMRRGMADQRGQQKGTDLERLEQRLRAAVEAGRMAPEEARKRLRAYKERMSEER